MLSLLVLLTLSIPRYLVMDVKHQGIEYLEKQGVIVIAQVDSITYLVEGYLDKMDHSPYEIALYTEPEKVSRTLFRQGKYYIPPMVNVINTFFNMINPDSIFSVIQRLQDFRTRYAYTDSCRRAERFLREKLASYSNYSELWPVTWNGTQMFNVVAEKTGVSQKFIIISSHLDSISNDPWNNAPGADDNASGTAVVMECARILNSVSSPFVTFKYTPFTAEELGLIGSNFYAEYVASQNLPLLGVFNSDMVGYNPQDGLDFDINLDTLSLLGQVTRFVVNNYVYGNNRWSFSPFSGSDHYPFARRGYPWVFLIESNYQYNPNYHRTSDLITTLDTLQMVNAVKIALGVSLYFALLPLPPESLVALSYGDGQSVVLRWPRAGYSGESYVIYRGGNPQILLPILETTDTFAIISGHFMDSTYYYMVRTKVSGIEGFGTPVKEVYVNDVPLPPILVSAEPMRNSISLTWKRNTELDIEGYNIYRSLDGTNYVKINSDIITDTTYVDFDASMPVWYSYYITAIDSTGYESSPSDTLEARPVTLSEGILVLDEFRDGSGTSPVAPNQAMQEAFIDSVLYLSGMGPYTILNVASFSKITLSHLGIYGLVWVMSDDYTEPLGSRYSEALKRYISFGGKVIIEGYKNLSNLGIVSGYPSTIPPNNPYGLELDTVYLNTSLDFVRGYSGLYNLEIHPNPLKIVPSWSGKLPNIEAYKVLNGDVIYQFDSYTDNPNFEGKACGVILGDSLVLLGFPLYYMETQDVVRLFNFLRSREFNVREVVKKNPVYQHVVRENYLIARDFERGKAHFYDVQGRLALDCEFYNGKIDISTLPSGIYFVSLERENSRREIKLIRIK